VSYQVDWSPAVLLAASIDKGFLLASLFSIWLKPGMFRTLSPYL
jgi:hypothetical protein